VSVSSSSINERRSTAGPALLGVGAVVLAGGLGTRLRPAVGDTPKSMAAVAGTPFLAHLLLWLRRSGVRDVVLAVGYRADEVERHVGTGDAWDLRVRYSPEPEPLGTGGALRLALPQLGGTTCLALNGDSFFDVDLARLLAFHRRKGALATIAAVSVAEPQRYGGLDIDADGSVRRFIEKGAAPGGTGSINAGVYILDRAVLDGIPEGRPVSLEREVFPGLTDGRLYAMPSDGYFVDIGLPADYAAVDANPERLLAAVEGGPA
jgi:NDP-sugar pyrophosphorylase family protein